MNEKRLRALSKAMASNHTIIQTNDGRTYLARHDPRLELRPLNREGVDLLAFVFGVK